MKLLTLLVCFALYAASSNAHMYEACPAGWMNFRKSCYRYFGQTLNQITAENVCRMFSGCGGGIGHLVSINDKPENDFIFNHLKSIAGVNPPPPAWLGGRRTPGTDRWQWSDGTPIMPFSAWMNQSPPQEQGRNCMVFSESQQPIWTHMNCAAQMLPYMCEMKANVPQDPATCVPNNPGAGPRQGPLKVPDPGAGPQPGPLKVPDPLPIRHTETVGLPDPLPMRHTKTGWREQRHSARP